MAFMEMGGQRLGSLFPPLDIHARCSHFITLFQTSNVASQSLSSQPPFLSQGFPCHHSLKAPKSRWPFSSRSFALVICILITDSALFTLTAHRFPAIAHLVARSLASCLA